MIRESTRKVLSNAPSILAVQTESLARKAVEHPFQFLPALRRGAATNADWESSEASVGPCPQCGGPPSDYSCLLCAKEFRFAPVCAAPIVYEPSILDMKWIGRLQHRRLGTKPGRIVPREEAMAA